MVNSAVLSIDGLVDFVVYIRARRPHRAIAPVIGQMIHVLAYYISMHLLPANNDALNRNLNET